VQHKIFRRIVSFFLTLLLAGFLGATLVRVAPGFGVDERNLDARLSAESQQALREQQLKDSNIFSFYARYLGSLLRGDLGESRILQRPVTELLRERLPVTIETVFIGVAGGWSLGLGLALLNAFFRAKAFDALSTLVSGLFLCLPIAALVVLFVYAGTPARYAVVLLVFPNVYRYSSNLISKSFDQLHILAARAKGLSRTRVLFRHILLPVAPQLIALAGVTVSLAFSAAIPVEAIADSPGIGQLAWQAALGRDLPVLVNLTLLVTAFTLLANSGAELVSEMWSGRQREGRA
jgi:peptide/nickel transport system permease protein